MDVKELTDKDLAAQWRRGVDKNRKLSQELVDRGYKFNCIPHGGTISFHESNEVRISKQETTEL